MSRLELRVQARVNGCLYDLARAINQGDIELMGFHNDYFKRQNGIMYKYLLPGEEMFYQFYQRAIDCAIREVKEYGI